MRVDVDGLPLTQYLLMEALAGRYRTGEEVWTFPSNSRPVLRSLAGHGLIGWKEGIVDGTCLAWLTEDGRSACLSESYTPPCAQESAQEGRGGAAGANAYPSAATEVPKTARDDAQTPPGAPETPGGSTETREAQNGSQSPAQPSEV